jgi:hypothetical protein
MERIQFVTHRNHRILLLDFTDCEADELATLFDRVPEIVTREPQGSVLILADFSGTEFSRDAVERLKIAAAIDRPHVKRAAWVQAENLPKTLYDSVRTFSAREFPVFPNREEALEYLVS